MKLTQKSFFLLLLIVQFFSVLHGQNFSNLSEGKLIKYREIRDSLIQKGFLLDQNVMPAQSESNGSILENAWFTEKEIAVSTLSSRQSDFMPDGTRFYILGRDTENIIEYHLSDPWNIESAEFVREFDISDEMGSAAQSQNAAHGLFFRKSDGERMWVLNRTEIWEYTLTTPWDVSSATQTGYQDLSDVVTRGHDMDFKPDGSVLYVDDRISEVVYQFELTTDWDVETAVLDFTLDISDQQEAVRGIQLSPAGNRMFLMDTGRREVLEYWVSDAFDLRSVEFVGSFSVASESVSGEGSPEGLTFRPTLENFYVTSNHEDIVYQYKISVVDPDESSVTADRSKVIADGSATSRIMVVARDNDGDGINGRKINLSANSSSVDIDVISNTTNLNGEALFDVRNSVEESVTFTASSPNTTIDETATVLFVGVDEEESSVESNKAKVLADGDAISRITVIARDFEGDELSDVQIRLEANSGNVNIDEETKNTNSDGEATFEVSNNVAETVVFTAEGLGTTIEKTATVTFVTVDPGESSVVSANSKVIANGEQPGRITVTARDKDGEVLEGVSIILNSDSETADIESVNSTTDSEGIARFDVTNTVIELVEFEASGLGIEINQEATIRFTIVDADESSIAASHEKVLANGVAAGKITVTARDEDGDVLEGVQISLIPDGGSSNIQNVQSTTDEDGIAIFEVTNEITERVDYSAKGMGVTITQSITIEFVTVDPRESSVVADTMRVEANGEDTSTITITARDKDGEVLQGVEIDLSSDLEQAVIVALNNITDIEGLARFRVSSESPGRVTFTATAIRTGGNIEITEKALVEFIPIAPVSLAATNVTTNGFIANWELVSGASSYIIDVSKDSTFNSFVNNYNSLNAGSTTEFNVTNLEPGTIYFYRVRAEENNVIGSNSTPIKVETLPEIPVSQNPVSRGVTRFSASWEAAPGAQEYLLDVSIDEEFDEFLDGYENVEVGNNLSYEVTGLFPGTTYYYRVRSKSFTKSSSSSSVIQTSTAEIGIENSEVNSSQMRVLANGNQRNFITVILRDTQGKPIGLEKIQLEAEQGNSSIEEVEPETNEDGEATFAVTNTVAEKVTYKAFIKGTSFEIGSISVEFLDDGGGLELGNNYPNPFRNVTTLPLTVPEPMNVRIVVTNILGATVKEVVIEELNTGYYEIEVDLRDLASGIYFYRMITDDKIETKKMLMVR